MDKGETMSDNKITIMTQGNKLTKAIAENCRECMGECSQCALREVSND
jgi:hypothetical protein